MSQMVYLPYCPEHLSPNHLEILSSKHYQISEVLSCQQVCHGTNDVLHKQQFPVHSLQFLLMILQNLRRDLNLNIYNKYYISQIFHFKI